MRQPERSPFWDRASRRPRLASALALAPACAPRRPWPSRRPGRPSSLAPVSSSSTPSTCRPPATRSTHHAAGCAKVMCSAVFMTGLDPAFAWENIGYFTCPREERSRLGTPVVDREHKRVRVTPPGGAPRVAAHLGAQGCLALPIGRETPFFTPVQVKSVLPDALAQPWPMGDAPPKDPPPTGLLSAKIAAAVDAAFEPAAMTAAFVVTWKGRIVAERYGPGITAQTPARELVDGQEPHRHPDGRPDPAGGLRLEQPAPIPEWQKPGDRGPVSASPTSCGCRAGCRIRAPQDPEFDPALRLSRSPLSIHGRGRLVRVRGDAAAAVAAQHGRPLSQHRSVLINYLIRLRSRSEARSTTRSRSGALFDKIGMRTMVMETDPYGNFLTQGYELGSAPRLGAARQPLPSGRRVERRAAPPRGLRGVREHPGAGLGGRRPSDLRRVLLDQRRRRVPGAEGRVLHGGRRRSDHADRALATIWWWSARPLPGEARPSKPWGALFCSCCRPSPRSRQGRRPPPVRDEAAARAAGRPTTPC